DLLGRLVVGERPRDRGGRALVAGGRDVDQRVVQRVDGDVELADRTGPARAGGEPVREHAHAGRRYAVAIVVERRIVGHDQLYGLARGELHRPLPEPVRLARLLLGRLDLLAAQ